MSHPEESDSPDLKVNDRRRFAPDGSPLETAPAADKPAESVEKPSASSSGPETELGPDFASFVLSLAAGAQAGLGIAPHPVTGKREVHLGQAKYSIDLLGLLQEKTRGNLTPEEGQLIEALLYDLRMRYVEAKQKV